ncbi:hypothetical protein [Pontibacter sp. G13]|uniref:beta strand repeat-containing protein n=1 Tax=Pontibacter sp. G13 TaxID=3074898 RepID=UPI0028891852|nr:hypothetical protein [Pontibacter sp. G13]WNJ18705.1 hypothetical protein RJD25_27940 [Pontibacter sp. G13]
MKNRIFAIGCLLIAALFSMPERAQAQAPEKFQYQAVARDNAGAILANQATAVRISIREFTATGNIIYQESFNPTTNQYGLFTLEIGSGSVLSGFFGSVDWGNGPFFLEVEMDPNGGSSYAVMGTSQLLSVPYALYAESAGNTDDADADPVNELQSLSITGSDVSLSNGGGTITLPAEVDGDVTNELQSLSITGSDVSLSNGGGTITLPAEVDGDVTNELQSLSITGSDVSLSNGGGTITLPAEVDGDVTNELQSLSITGSDVSLSNGGGTITLPAEVDGDVTNELQSLSITGSDVSLSNGGGTITLPAEVDGDVTNELQSLSITGSDVSLSNGGGTITLPAEVDGDVTNELQSLSITGSDVSLSNGGGTITLPAEVDGDVTNELQSLSITGSDVSLSNGGGTITLPAEVDGDVTNELQSLSITGSDVSLSNGGGTITLPAELDGDVTNELQSLSITGSDVSLSNGGGTITLPAEVDGDVTNELQSLSITGNDVSLSNGGGTITLPAEVDGDVTNELQSLSITGNTLSLSQSGGSVLIPSIWGLNALDAYYLGGNVGIGTNSPNALLELNGQIDALRLIGPGFNGSWSQVSFGNFGTSGMILEPSGLFGLFTDYQLSMTSNGGFNYWDNGFLTVRMGRYSAGSGGGYVNTYSSSGLINSLLSETAVGGGFIGTYGPNGQFNISLSSLVGNADNGYVGVWDQTGAIQAGVYVDANGDGIVFGDQKNFRMDHPLDPQKEIWYGSLEGPELAAYVRGTAELVNGEATVEFPEYYQLVGNAQTMTVILTPLSGQSEGLAVVEKTSTGFRVVELRKGSGTYSFDWEVKCVRQGYEDYRVIRDKSEMTPTTSNPQVEAPRK